MRAENAKRWRRRAPWLAAAAAVLAVGPLGLLIGQLPDRGASIEPVAPSAALRPAARGQPDNSFADAFRRGVAQLRGGDAHAAALAFEQARGLNPHVAEVYANLGYSYLEMGRARDAESMFTRALKLHPAQVNAYFGLAEALEAAGDLPGARGAMRTWLHLAPPDDPFRRRAMAAMWEWGERDGAAPDAVTAAAPAVAPAVAAYEPAVPEPLPAVAEDPSLLAPPPGGIVLVNVWAAWCGPCRAELPSLETLAGKLDPAQVRLVGLNIDRDRAFAREFIRDVGFDVENLWDANGVYARERWGVDSFPQTLLLDGSGRLLNRVIGARDWADPEIVAWIEQQRAAASETGAARNGEAK